MFVRQIRSRGGEKKASRAHDATRFERGPRVPEAASLCRQMGRYPSSRASTDIRVCRLAEDGRHTVRYRAVCLIAAAPTWKWKSRLRDAPLLETATLDGLNPASQQLRHNWHSQSPPRRLVRQRALPIAFSPRFIEAMLPAVHMWAVGSAVGFAPRGDT